MKNLSVRLFIVILLLSVGHNIVRIRKVKYILLTIQLLRLHVDLGLDAMGLVQSSVERYHDVCGPGRTISMHTPKLFRVQKGFHIKMQ